MITLLFIFLLLVGVPIAFVLGLSSLVYLIDLELPLVLVPQRLFNGLNSFLLLAVPLFILAGEIMNASGITTRLLSLAAIFIRHVRGGLTYITVVGSMLMSGITGVGSADAAAIGSVMIPAMQKQGYKDEYAAAILASSTINGPIIPPSIAMVVYGAMTDVSIASLFLAGFIPGIVIALAIVIVAGFYAKKYDLPKSDMKPPQNSREMLEACLAILMPVIILGGILGGIFTPTEAAGVAVTYAIIVGVVVLKQLKFSDLPRIFADAGRVTGSVLMIIGTATLFGWVLARENVPEQMAEYILSLSNNKYMILFLINVLLLFVGTFMETLAAIVLLIPVLFPLVTALGVDPVHFGVIVAVNLSIGLVTPPLGVCSFIACSIAKIKLEQISKALIPFIVSTTIALMIITYVPEIVLWLPRLFNR
ncbi:MAG: TRAP transporter large permease [Bacteroidota bacterium]